MDWTIDDALHSRIIRWKIKCKNIFDHELAILQESAKCKKVTQWSGDAGLDMYISWALPTEEVTLQTIWSRFEDFCKPRSNAVHAWYNLFTTFWQGNRSIDEWYNVVQAHISLCECPQETAAILTRDIFWFFMTDNEFIAKTINEGNTELAQYPAAKVWQMAKKLESSKATAKHIKQHTSSMQGAAQLNVLWYNHTSLQPKKKKGSKKPNPSKGTKPQQILQQNSQTNTNLMIEIQVSVLDVVIPHIHKDLTAWLRSTNPNIAQKLDASQRCALTKMHTISHSNIINISQNRYIKLLYLNILLSSTKKHVTVIMMTILW